MNQVSSDLDFLSTLMQGMEDLGSHRNDIRNSIPANTAQIFIKAEYGVDLRLTGVAGTENFLKKAWNAIVNFFKSIWNFFFGQRKTNNERIDRLIEKAKKIQEKNDEKEMGKEFDNTKVLEDFDTAFAGYALLAISLTNKMPAGIKKEDIIQAAERKGGISKKVLITAGIISAAVIGAGTAVYMGWLPPQAVAAITTGFNKVKGIFGKGGSGLADEAGPYSVRSIYGFEAKEDDTKVDVAVLKKEIDLIDGVSSLYGKIKSSLQSANTKGGLVNFILSEGSDIKELFNKANCDKLAKDYENFAKEQESHAEGKTGMELEVAKLKTELFKAFNDNYGALESFIKGLEKAL